jgi:hypothetical protein
MLDCEHMYIRRCIYGAGGLYSRYMRRRCIADMLDMYMRRCMYGAGGVAEERERKQHVYKEVHIWQVALLRRERGSRPRQVREASQKHPPKKKQKRGGGARQTAFRPRSRACCC